MVTYVPRGNAGPLAQFRTVLSAAPVRVLTASQPPSFSITDRVSLSMAQLNIPNFWESQAFQYSRLAQFGWYGIVRCMNAHSGTSVADRCIRLRKAMGYDYHGGQMAFAKFLGVPVGTWNNVERGTPLSKNLAFRLVQKCPGVTTEWLWFGGAGGLSLRMAQALEEVPVAAKGKTRHSVS